jgi:pimeloyl-ACP methyl ester carboxylesterase
MWERLMPFFQSIPVLRVHLPGFGGSAPAPAASMRTYADAVLAVLDAENIGQCVLVGHSLGGYVALQIAAQAPARLAGLGLLHSHPFADSEERLDARRRALDMLHAGKKDLYVAQMIGNLFAPEFKTAQPDRVTAFVRNGQRQSLDGIIGAVEAMMARQDTTAVLRAVACPVWFGLGKKDPLIQVDEALKAAVLPAISAVEVWPGVAHMGMEEAPEAVARALTAFLLMTSE